MSLYSKLFDGPTRAILTAWRFLHFISTGLGRLLIKAHHDQHSGQTSLLGRFCGEMALGKQLRLLKRD
ncbi:hypothetical protein C7U92_23650 [Bradyrhizobium sp. WBOS7]|uniref:Uncharacterized protein n=1 Tax=Bradyrhizobium betae TaxID=244734 RepID=A0AAE9N7X8_9BRAD|nr:hypothetical protein [Bradyrhizobium sp. WBOS2]MDD1570513.1 hypothetical protein [Bradyrhizobium sp. WBOS1]MDD1579696.1 hypothetical protein [Bradyrhizobium sp. WBOS7]MDD1600994.1 hypothetical protein [Bradyrhizobium sp. WBOS16]UUO35018.1 hypothetical protein DCK84_10890 [Bradyrhizobium sp. WBOS01]UUO41347.1 hypothetical protein DCM75_11740 [Bradyrhizobium sp. WBOS02]UUO55664.1 hypothetical protein DCM79_23435 [Bradyrhizobium sp. WBOS07]UUO65711.1 hypothetical protein DCM83_11220 [Bradyrh